MKDKLKHIPLGDIKVGDRFRKDLGDIDELVESIKEKGILQPVTVDESFNLLAGGRRYTAATMLELDSIPALIRKIEGEVDAREIELIENIHRKSFTWQEECALIRELDRLYREKEEGWNLRKTASLLDKSLGDVSKKINLAESAEKIDAVSECESMQDAVKLIDGIRRKAIEDTLVKRQQEAINSPDPSPDHQGHTDPNAMNKSIKLALRLAEENYMIGDVFEGMASLRDGGHIDLIECDPPYGIDLNTVKRGNSNIGSTAQSYNEVPKDQYQTFLQKLCKELYRIAFRDSWLVFWYGPTWHTEVKQALEDAHWVVDDIPCIWTKGLGQTQQPEYYLARAYEPFFICRKGKPLINKRGRPNIFAYSPEAGQRKYHPTQRPTDLIEEIMNTFLAGRSNVFVPFLGSGATLRSCYNLGHKGFGFDLSDEYKGKFMLTVEEDCRKLYSEDD